MQDMKIGIFGDSFSDHDENNDLISWPYLLSFDYNVSNYSKTGTSTYYSYNKFLENYKKFDKIIFVVTQPHRIHTKIGPIANAMSVNYYLNQDNLSISERKILKGLKAYLENSILDEELDSQHVLFHNLMIEDIKRLHNKILFIPAFNNKGTICTGSQLTDITFKENDYWGITGAEWYSKKDLRQCHMSEPNNKWLYQNVKEILTALDNHVVFDFNLNDIEVPDNKEKYFTNWY